MFLGRSRIMHLQRHKPNPICHDEKTKMMNNLYRGACVYASGKKITMLEEIISGQGYISSTH